MAKKFLESSAYPFKHRILEEKREERGEEEPSYHSSPTRLFRACKPLSERLQGEYPAPSLLSKERETFLNSQNPTTTPPVKREIAMEIDWKKGMEYARQSYANWEKIKKTLEKSLLKTHLTDKE